MINFKTLQTDFYQISMAFAYVLSNKANVTTGFEGFVRNVKAAVNPNRDFYIFSGEQEVKDYIETVKKEIRDPQFIETFIELIEPKITAKNKEDLIQEFREKWKTLDFDFEYNVVAEGSIVFPFVPVFQYKGPKIWGQLIETYVTNIYNGKTAFATLKKLKEEDKAFVTDSEFIFIKGIMENNPFAINEYTKNLERTAEEFRKSTDKILLEAAFRRAPTKIIADVASNVAISKGWDGTSNVSNVLNGMITADKVGGTMAHAFVMSFENERDAFKAWDRIFPGTTMLIDTYDVENAAKMIKEMVDNGEITKPNDLRIDSDPIDDYCKLVYDIFDNAIGIFVSGDMDTEKFEILDGQNIPYSKAMAGTKYVYENYIASKLNSGFVYKIVEYINEDGKTIRPEKKANGKSNYPGLKMVSYDEFRNVLTIWNNTDKGQFGFSGMSKIKPDSKIEFKTSS